MGIVTPAVVTVFASAFTTTGTLAGKTLSVSSVWTWATEFYDPASEPSVQIWNVSDIRVQFPLKPGSTTELYAGYLTMRLLVDGVAHGNELRMNVVNLTPQLVVNPWWSDGVNYNLRTYSSNGNQTITIFTE